MLSDDSQCLLFVLVFPSSSANELSAVHEEGTGAYVDVNSRSSRRFEPKDSFTNDDQITVP